MDVFFSDEDRYEYLHEMAEQGERFGVTFHARARGRARGRTLYRASLKALTGRSLRPKKRGPKPQNNVLSLRNPAVV